MFIFFGTVFSVAVAGLVILIVFKQIEIKKGEKLFSPQWLRDRDQAIEKGVKQMFGKTRIGCVKCAKASWHIVHSSKGTIQSQIQKVRTRRFSKKIEHNGGSSVYLKQVIEHKNNVRNGEE